MLCNYTQLRLCLLARLLVSALLLLCVAATMAQAQAPAGLDTGSLTRWPPYVQETETLNRGRIVMSLVGGRSHTGGTLRNSSLYADLEFGLTDRLLLAVAASTSVSTGAATKLDDAVIHARYRFANESPRRPAFAIATTFQRQTFLQGTGISPYEAQVAVIVQKAMAGVSFYGQAGYTTRNQPFEGLGVRRGIGERLVVSGNYSYRHDRIFEESFRLPAQSHPTSAVAYATAYFAASERLGLTAAVGRSFPSHSDSGGFTRFASIGIGFALKR